MRGKKRRNLLVSGIAAKVTLDETDEVLQIRLSQRLGVSRGATAGSGEGADLGKDVLGGRLGINAVERFFRVFEIAQATYFERVEIPYYLALNSHKKLDICGAMNGRFGEIAGRIITSNRTFLRHDRLYTLWQAVRNVSHMESPMIEIGICRGGSLMFLLESQRAFGKKGLVYGSDTFTGHAFVKEGVDGDHAVGGFSEYADYEDVKRYLSEDRDCVLLESGPIESTVDTITEQRFSLVHIDVDVYPTIKFCLETFGDRLESGGFMVVDDYGFTTCPGAFSAVEEFVRERQEFQHMHLLTGQALLQRR